MGFLASSIMAQIQELFVDGIGRMHFVGGMIHLEFMRYIPVADGKAPLQQCTFCLIMPMHGFLDSINSMQDLMMRLLDFGIFHKESAYPPLRLLKNDPEEDNAVEAKNDNKSQNQQDIQNTSIKQNEQNTNSNQNDIKQNEDTKENNPIIEEKNILKMPSLQRTTEQKDSVNSEAISENVQRQEISQKTEEKPISENVQKQEIPQKTEEKPIFENVQEQEIPQQREEKLVEEKNILESKELQHTTEQKDSVHSEPISENVQEQSTNKEEIHSKDKKSKGLFGWLKKK
jgi:hypothetical protein